MGTFNEIGASLISPLFNLWQSFVDVFPGIVWAIIILIVGYFIALIVGHAVKLLLEKAGLDARVRKAKLTKTIGHTHLPNVFGEITKWYVFLVFLQGAVSLLNLGVLSNLLGNFVLWLPHLIAALLIVLFGIALGNYLEFKISEHSRMKGAKTAGKFVKLLVVFILIIVAAEQISIRADLLEQIVLILIGGLALGIALAVGLGLGLGMKDDIAKGVKKFKKFF